MPMFPVHRGPMSPEEILRERQRIAGMQQSLTVMPTDVGQGLTALGTAIGARMAQHRLDQQFPAAPGMAAPQHKAPIQQFAETISGNRMPWQFPGAPPNKTPDGVSFDATSQARGTQPQGQIGFPSATPAADPSSKNRAIATALAQTQGTPQPPPQPPPIVPMGPTGPAADVANYAKLFGKFKPGQGLG